MYDICMAHRKVNRGASALFEYCTQAAFTQTSRKESMLYTWKHKPTGLKIEVERKMDDSDIPPTESELIEEGLIEEDFMKGWEKVVTGGSYSKGFTGPGQGKGHW